MIVGIFYQSSGLGNQLHRMVATRIKALELGVDWRMVYIPNDASKEPAFKGKEFMKFDESKLISEIPVAQIWNEKKVIENGVDLRSYDPEFNFIQDNTI